MATQGGTSRLAQMQMRFQQKQQQEREQRKIEMTGTKTNLDASFDSRSLNTSFGNGKVRQMFDERRQRGMGIDKSYPLKPIAPRSSPGTGGTSSSGGGGMSTTTTATVKSTTTTARKHTGGSVQINGRVRSTTSATKTSSPSEARETFSLLRQGDEILRSSTLNGNPNTLTLGNGNNSILNKQNNNGLGYDVHDSEELSDSQLHQYQYDSEILDTTTMPSSKLPNVGKLASLSLDDSRNGNPDIGDRNNNNNNSSINNTNRHNQAVNNGIKLKPLPLKKASPLDSTSKPTAGARNPPSSTLAAKSRVSPTSRPPVPARTPSDSKTNLKSSAGSASSRKSSTSLTQQRMGTPTKQSPSTPPDGMAACHICGRFFNKDRVEKHEQICQKTATKKRKVFDVTKHRVKGTEAEQYLKKSSKTSKPAAAAPAAAASTSGSSKKSDWRRKHEEFIQAIRAAKEVQQHLARGGKLSDLPPPPPSENPDYIQCPHCSRKFNEAAATRHIPKCANMLHNKPKPGAGAKKKR